LRDLSKQLCVSDYKRRYLIVIALTELLKTVTAGKHSMFPKLHDLHVITPNINAFVVFR
jgi:hypothetical protein